MGSWSVQAATIMIRSIRCDKPSFKSADFRPGFNAILAERTKEATRKDSRNGLGKTTLIEIIHFCLGSKPEKDQTLMQPEVAGWTFSMELDLAGHRITVHRNTGNPKRVQIEGDWSTWPIKPQIDSETDKAYMPIALWNDALGQLMFGLRLDETNEKYSPTFRSLISYFVRNGRDAFSNPFEHFRKQNEWDKQVNNAFLLRLAWENAQQWQQIKDREKILMQLKQAAASGLMPNLLGTIGELEAVKIRLEQQVARGKEQLDSFRVHPQYHEIEERSNLFTRQIHDLANDNVTDRRLVEFYQASLEQERPVERDQVAQLYEEAGVTLPDMVIKRLDEVEAFREKIVANRKAFIQDEIDRLQRQIIERERGITSSSDQRANLMVILQTHGALEEYTRLQQLYLQSVSELEDVKGRIENLRRFEQGRSAVRIEKENLQIKARTEYDTRLDVREQAVGLFNAISETLYEAPGTLIVDILPTGFKFDVSIQRSRSQGFEQMKVFCYDLMLAQLWAQQDASPGFLVHDSTIFDGVDERQTAHSLEVAARESGSRGFQYICLLNSDTVPWSEFTEGFNLRDHVRLTLTDAEEGGSLLGIRF